MSSISPSTSLTGSSSSIHSIITANLPRICDDTECLYPFGPACIACSFSLDIKENSKRRPQPEERTDEWVEEMQINRHIVLHAGEEFTGGADEVDPLIVDNDSDSEDSESSEEGSKVGEGVSETGYEADSDCDLRSNSTISSLPRLHTSQKLSSFHSIPSYISGSAFTTSAFSLSSNYTPNAEPDHLSPWLSTIFDHTLHGHVTNTRFAGGADIEQDFSTVEKCELCGRSIGEATHQHWLKCKFAHEELERVRIWGTAWSE
ncbi:hypothetical protein VTL71DRAFT_14558 [Oculimacula yallundae]|uniref:Uncharacterized protein n=1 Tax=Oculimacula yallundae TaxID=86028 RepID=A0ABR4CIU6_9HELO